MEEQLLLSCKDEMECRYCLQSDNIEDMVAPCRCTGSSKYVHQKCLREWFEKSNNAIVIPGKFNQFNTYSCEICHANYTVKMKERKPKESLNCTIAKYIFVITIGLVGFYIGIGSLMVRTRTDVFSYMSDMGYWYNLIFNGFCMTHLVIGLFYIIAGLLMSFSGPCYCFCFPSMNMGTNSDGFIVVIFMIIFIGIVVSVLMIYFDVISRIVQRHKNNLIDICEFSQYIEPSAPEIV